MNDRRVHYIVAALLHSRFGLFQQDHDLMAEEASKIIEAVDKLRAVKYPRKPKRSSRGETGNHTGLRTREV